jgi:hypothetical protein
MSETARKTIDPKVYQLSILLENRVGLLLQLTRELEKRKVHICALSIVNIVDAAVVRLVVDNVEGAKRALQERGLTVYEAELVAVELPTSGKQSIATVLSNLLRAEINIQYCYTLLTRSRGSPVLALYVDSRESAVRVLQDSGFTCIGHDDILWDEPHEPA